jgi:hypothetical protein
VRIGLRPAARFCNSICVRGQTSHALVTHPDEGAEERLKWSGAEERLKWSSMNDRPHRPTAARRREARVNWTVARAAAVSDAIGGPVLSQPVTGDRRGAIRAGSRDDGRVG